MPLATAAQVFFTAYAQSDVFGRLIILSLVALSLISWLVLMQKYRQNRSVRRLGMQFLHALAESKQPILSLDMTGLPKRVDHDLFNPFAALFKSVKCKAIELLEKNHHFLKHASGSEDRRVFLATSDFALIQSHCDTTISAEIKRLESNLYILSTIVTLSPFLGLLGTVWGILVTFAGLQGGSLGALSNSAILGGLSTALATTVLGLIVAIPALIGFNTLRASLRRIASDLDDFSSYLLGNLEVEYRKVEI